MADLPARPSLDHLRRQARDLLRAARAGDTTAAGRIRAVADALTLASAQLAVAREYGFASRTRLRYEVTARTASLARQAEVFCEASIRDGAGRAARMLAAHLRARPLQLRHRGDPGRRRPRADRARPGVPACVRALTFGRARRARRDDRRIEKYVLVPLPTTRVPGM
jgi:hypothetical protein